MIVIENHLGSIRISRDYLYTVIEHTVTACFGVADLHESSLLETIKTKLFPGDIRRGIRLRSRNNALVIDLHIVTGIGANVTSSPTASAIRCAMLLRNLRVFSPHRSTCMLTASVYNDLEA